MGEALLIGVVGAESTGKTTLAHALVPALAAMGRRVALVDETLRSWCERMGRTPRAEEQASILRAHQERIDAAAATHEIVVCDTTALATAVYSALLFGDRSLEERALVLQRRMAATLLTAIDLPWVADGHQRDGEHVRAPVDAALRALLQRGGVPYSVIGGEGEARLVNALAALRPLLAEPGTGRFTGLEGTSRGRWTCECCVPGAEQALKSLQQ